MKSLTEILIDSDFEDGLKAGADDDGLTILKAYAAWEKLRSELNSQGCPPFLTDPKGNQKLAKGVIPAYGLTLQHYVQKLSTGLTINACPSAGDCTKVCVLDNGYGRYDMVQHARRMRTEFMARFPYFGGVIIGWELKKAIIKWGKILFRPNVNSDVAWESVAPSLTDGSIFNNAIHSYGYSKLPSTLKGIDTPHYTVAYSVSEKTNWAEAEDFLAEGGNVAVVTSRKPKTPITQWHPRFKVVDADLTDEWMLDHKGVIGDLSAKGKAQKLIGKSGFVRVL